MTLTTTSTQFLLDGKPFHILSGAIHYFRVVPEYWRDRLEKIRAFGLNTVETYVAWNLHEPRPDEFHFDGMLDIVKFIETGRIYPSSFEENFRLVSKVVRGTIKDAEPD